MVKLTEIEKKQAEQEKGHEAAEHGHKEDKVKQAKTEITPKTAEKKEVKAEKVLKSTATLHDLEVILYPLVTEKAVNMIEAENKITFIVNDNTTKPEIKKVLQEAYGIKVNKVNVIRDMKGRKKAIVQIDKKFKASELATKLGVL